ncbi:hypothetical protein BDN72DRAFT_876176 [Pluteus cervinus]|uniref:Uncharacterized protein n=1 Tax=Pluteus cervinus TaxID=181527 RepID=A0ACD3B4E5_9AGAR|nr:hypothetical protein BDN72DRAFT_876176 [Pluteus cervinus]
MVHLYPVRHVDKRQTNPMPVPTLAGISGAATINPDATGATSLVLDDSVTGGPQMTAPPLTVSIPKPTFTPSSSPGPLPSPAKQPDVQANATRPISMSTVIGACVGAFFGASILISIAFMFYRRYSKSLKTKARTLQSNQRSLNTDSAPRSRSRQDNWNKLDDGDDKWEGQYQTKELGHVSSMEKMTMFKKSTPSVKTYHSEEHISVEAFPQSLAQYHHSLTNIHETNPQDASPHAHSFLGRVDAGPPLSWGSEVDRSFLSFHSTRLSSGAVSPTLAIPTPIATIPPHWESAEVVSMAEAQSAIIVNPFDTDSEHRQSNPNPFFSAQEYTPSHKRNQSSTSTSLPKRLDKGKGRAIEPDPFEDDNNHLPAEQPGGDRALQSLIAALDIPSGEGQDRQLRIASMQPSIVSAVSAFTEGDEDDMADRFPLPPLVASHDATHMSS